MQAFKYFIHGILTGLLIAVILFYVGLSRNLLNTNREITPSKTDKISNDRESAITGAVKEVSPAVVGINVVKLKKEKVR
ncbi:MAG: hypothetical protein L6407_06060, partial [Candidatus Delongbacteria bacterium]|nr:hypothetical protein [Candidatus Delongbacteria bacterium]